MPLTRYQIRNEFSLADPELYRAADRDDPEALLEGVAMAGLVGVLRQLGDLAEFAAEIFHDLHEELMATAARGHGLTLRVQQLEAEVPLIEKAFLSQITHSSFIHNAGIDWHPNLQVDENLITRGDLPRFVMDSYEECRGPPRLFLLDKFDIAGAGACLKRYSDPSFFRADLTTRATKEEVKRDKRARKVKKKVPRWKNVETPELTSSHSKLHQLFSEEHQQSQNIIHNHHAKLKKRQSKSSYADAATGRSYMERFLPSSPDIKFVSRRSASPSHLKMAISNFGELVPSHEIPSNSPADKLVMRDESSVQPQTAREKALDPSLNELSEDVIKEENMKKSPESTTDVELDGISTTLHEADNTKELILYGERNIDVNGYRSDDATSEMENYVDALATIESEMETDSESRPKNEHRVMIKKKLIYFGGNGKQKELHDNLSDSHSRGSSIASYDRDTPIQKGRSISSYSESSSNSAENVTSDCDLAVKLHPYPHDEVSYSKMTSDMGNALGSKSEKYVAPNSTFSEAPGNPSNYVSQFREESYNSEITNSTPGSCDSSSGVSLKEVQSSGLKSSEVSSRYMNSAIGESPRTEIDRGNRKDELSSSNNVFKHSSELRWYSPSLGSQQSKSLEMVGGENPETFSLAGEENGNDHVATFEARSLSDDADDNQIENMVNGKTDSTGMPVSIPDSPADVNLSDVWSDGIVMEAGSVTQTAESSECLTLVVGRPATDNFGVQKHREMADQAPPLEWDSAEIGNSGNELESSCNNLESIDEFGADGVSLDSPTSERKADVCTECNISDAQDLVSAEENHLHLHGLETENVCTDDGEDAKGDHMATGSLCRDQIELQECQSSSEDSDKHMLEINGVSNLNDMVRLDAEDEEENQPRGAPSNLNTDIPSNLNTDIPSNLNTDIVEDTQDHLHLSDGTDPPLLKETDHELELKQATHLSASGNDMSSSIHLSEPGLPLEQGLESEAEKDNMPYNQEVNENSNLIYHQYEQGQCQNKIESDERSNALPMSSSVEYLSQQSHLNLSHQSKIYEPSIVPSQQVSHDFDVPSEASIQVLGDRQPHTSPLGISLPDQNALPANPEEIPPLPPLPPVQWMIGKLRFGFPSSEGETAQQSFNPLLPPSAEAADERTQQGFPTFSGEVVQPHNPFLLNRSPDDKMLECSSEILGREMLQTSPSTLSSLVPVSSQEKIQQDSFTSDTTKTEPLKPFSPLSDEYDSSDFVELLDTSHMNLLAPVPAPTADDSSTLHVSSSSQKELEQSLDLSACIPNKEDEKLHDSNISSKQGTEEPQSSFTPPTIENEEPRHDSWTLEREREWLSNLSMFMPPAAEDGKPNGTKKSWLTRPRSPLIEAVASHDKSNLRKVTERVLPQTGGPKADERNSLLEQIRTKSFNLKPASLTRPSIKGPQTNLKVVAILEKANAIRQALAGSDEDDDEESWSDS